MTTNETVTITETAPDGTETVIEITTTKTDDGLNDGGESLVEEVIEALLDENPSDDTEYLVESDSSDTDFESDLDGSTVDLESETVDPAAEDYSLSEEMPTDETQLETNDVSTLPVENEIPADNISDVPFEPVANAPIDFGSQTDSTETSAASETNSTAEAELAEQQNLDARAEAARDAQEAADEFIAAGDYQAAAEAREVAENEAYAAGDDSMLSAYDSSDLQNAADKQTEAEYYEQQQAEFAQAGDYEAAREAASDAAYATKDADSAAGGDDHSGQAEAEENQMDWAVWEEKNADYYADNAEQYAAEGDFENAQMYAAEAVEHQEAADYHGDLGEHGGEFAVYDPSSEVDSGGTYDSTYDATTDTSTVDTGVDTTTDYSTE